MATAKTTEDTAKNTLPRNIFDIIPRIADEAGALAPQDSGGVPFKFRGVDQVVAHLAPLLDKYKVFQTARVVDKNTSARELENKDGTKTGKAVTQTDLTIEYTFWAPDGSSVATQAAGLAQDYADRSAAQAQSVAYRVALLQLFHLPTHDKEPEQVGEETQRKIEETAAADRSEAPKRETIESVRADITALINDKDSKVEGEDANAIMGEIAPDKTPGQWTLTELKKGRDKLQALSAERKNGDS